MNQSSYCNGSMAGKQNYIEKAVEVDSRDLRGLDRNNPDHHDATCKTEKKWVEDRAPPTSAQAVRQLQDSGSERQVAEQRKPMMNTGSRRLSPDIRVGQADPRNWQFVEDDVQKDMLSCKICEGILMSPYLLTCCGQCICKKCINSWLLREEASANHDKPRCPYCAQTEFRLIENSDLKKAVQKLKVYCLYHNSGCMWLGKLQEGEIHLRECAFCPVDCPNGCREYGKIERRNLSKHMAECPLQITECPYECVGCKSEGSLPRKEIQAHSNKDIHYHLVLLTRSNIRLHKEYDITLTTLRSSHNELLKEKTEKIDSQKQELASLEQIIKSLEADLLGLTQKISLLKETEDADRVRCTAQLKAKSEEVRGLHDVCQGALTEVQALPMPQAADIHCPPVTFNIDNLTRERALMNSGSVLRFILTVVATKCVYLYIRMDIKKHKGIMSQSFSI